MTTGRYAQIFCSALSIILFSSTLVSALPGPQTPHRNVFIIILNSIRYSDAFGDKRHLYVENMWEKIRPCGTLCENIYNNSITLPLPAQAVLLTGAPYNGKTTPPGLPIPTLFEYHRKQTGASRDKVLFAVSDSSFATLARGNSAEYGNEYAPTILENDTSETDANAIHKRAIAYIKEHHPSLVVLSLTTGKPVRHQITEKECKVLSQGLNVECVTAESINMYYEGIILVDMIVMKLWEMLQTDETYKNNTVFLVVSSQGRHTDDYTSFGDNCEGCSRLMCLITGPGVRKNHTSGKKRYLTDIVPTIGKLAGIRTEHATGHIMGEVLIGK